MPVCDCHMHTRVSPDANQREENNSLTYTKTAIERGLRHIAFTEHNDIITDKGAVNCDPVKAKEAVEEAREVYGKEIDIIHGIELAHVHRNECNAEGERILKLVKPDFVLGSLHILSNDFDFYFVNLNDFDDAYLLRELDRYIDEQIVFAKKGDFDSLAHCTYPLRYFDRAKRLGAVDVGVYNEKYAELFKILIERGKSLEINVSTMRAEYATPMPNFDLVKLYVDLGGKRFTIGTDSHMYEYVGIKVDEAQEYLKSIGIDGAFVYHNRQEEFVRF